MKRIIVAVATLLFAAGAWAFHCPADMRPLMPSGPLAAIVGSTPMPRTEVTSKSWAYIKKNKLQDAVNKRMINADAKLKEIFGKMQVSMFEMAGLIGKHLK